MADLTTKQIHDLRILIRDLRFSLHALKAEDARLRAWLEIICEGGSCAGEEWVCRAVKRTLEGYTAPKDVGGLLEE